MSLVFQPFSDGPEGAPLDYYHTVEITTLEDGQRAQLEFRQVGHLKANFLERQLPYTIDNISYRDITDLVGSTWNSQGFDLYDPLFRNCDSFARAVNKEILDTFETTPNGCQGDPFRKTWKLALREAILSALSAFSVLPVHSVLIVLIMLWPITGWLAVAMNVLNGYKYWKALPQTLNDLELVSSLYSGSSLQKACKILPYFVLVSLVVLVLQSFLVNDIGMVQVLLVVNTWNSFIKWYEEFGLAYADMFGVSRNSPKSVFANYPKPSYTLIITLKTAWSADLAMSLAFLAGEPVLYLLMVLVLVSCGSAVNDFLKRSFPGDEDSNETSQPKVLLNQLVNPVVLAVMVYNSGPQWFEFQGYLDVVCLMVHLICMICFCSTAWYMHFLDCQNSSSDVLTKTSQLFEAMALQGLLTEDPGLFNEQLAPALKTAQTIHQRDLPFLQKLSKVLPHLGKTYICVLVIMIVLCLYFNAVWVLLFLFGVSTWLTANIALGTMYFHTLVTSWRRDAAESKSAYACPCLGCGNTISGPSFYFCSRCSNLNTMVFASFCPGCVLSGNEAWEVCVKGHPRDILKMSYQLSVVQLLVMNKRTLAFRKP